MRRIARPSLAGCAVVLLLLLLVAHDAAANKLWMTGGSQFRITWAPLRISTPLLESVRCSISLEGSFHSTTMRKVNKSLVGLVTRFTSAACSGGTTTVLNATLPWHLQYEGFTGTLPNITALNLRLVGLSLGVTASGTACLFRASESGPMRLIVNRNTSNSQVSSVRVDEFSRLPVISGTCSEPTPSASGGGMTIGNTTSTYTYSLLEAEPEAVAVTVGDSFIAGEAGRWAGNTDREIIRMDKLGSSAYNDEAGGETIRGCHRSLSAEANAYAVGSPLRGVNYACSGARTFSVREEEGLIRPGLDFQTIEGVKGQALLLQEYARAHPRAIKLVFISIGGNNFGFGPIIQECVLGFITPPYWKCNEQAAMRQRISAEEVTARVREIKEGILEIRRAMREAEFRDERYRIVVQNYPSPIASSTTIRYTTANRWSVGGCPLWDEDINWANETVIPTIDEAVWTAVTETGLTNILRLELREVLNRRRLCEEGVGLYEEKGLESFNAPTAIDDTEWVSQIRVLPSEPFQRQEGAHPNYWAQKGLQACLKLVYNAGTPIGGRCNIAAIGRTAYGEPNMRLE
jgi:hypothetical protein